MHAVQRRASRGQYRPLPLIKTQDRGQQPGGPLGWDVLPALQRVEVLGGDAGRNGYGLKGEARPEARRPEQQANIPILVYLTAHKPSTRR
jgi:hypothetical protein